MKREIKEPEKPDLGTSAKLIEDSNLELVLCGGMSVGHYKQPLVWLLRSKYETALMQQRTKDLQRLVSAIRFLSECVDHVPKELRDRIGKFNENLNK